MLRNVQTFVNKVIVRCCYCELRYHFESDCLLLDFFIIIHFKCIPHYPKAIGVFPNMKD